MIGYDRINLGGLVYGRLGLGRLGYLRSGSLWSKLK